MTTSTVQSVNLLPIYFQTDKNSKFLSSTIDQLIQPSQLDRINAFIGSKITPNNSPDDLYVTETTPVRQHYQLNPALVTYDVKGSIQSVISINDLVNEIKIKGGYDDNFDRLFRSTTYSFYPYIDLDKFNNYQNYFWLPYGSFLINIDQDDLDISKTILGKSQSKVTVKGLDVNLLSGMLVTFTGKNIDVSYQYREFFVEGVGESIILIPISDLITVEQIASFDEDLYDSHGYDTLGYDGEGKYPLVPEYVTINRASLDRNPWSRYNRWISLDVIKISSLLNNSELIIPINNRASRPIIEFNANIKLFNFGSIASAPVSFIDNTITDAFSSMKIISGSNTAITDINSSTSNLIIDGVNLSSGDRIIFTADDDPLIKNKIFQVTFVPVGPTGTPTVALFPTVDSDPIIGSTVLVKKGISKAGTTWWFDGENWIYAQQHTQINEGPLFDLFDKNGFSYADKNHYLSNFNGNRIFGYSLDEGSGGVVDSVLDLRLKYINNNINSSVLFENYFLNDYINLVNFDSSVSQIKTNSTYFKVNDQLTSVWQKPLSQRVNFDSSAGFYDLPLNLTNNPLNEEIQYIVSGDMINQATSTGTQLIMNSEPISFAMMFIGKKEHSIINAINKISSDYDYFKLSLINQLSQVSDTKDPIGSLDEVIDKINLGKTTRSAFYLSDMMGFGMDKSTMEYIVDVAQDPYYPIPIEFSLSTPSYQSVLVYVNGIQLVSNFDYEFDKTDSYVILLKSLNVGDKITIVFYTDTKKNYVPPTPTKLGLYPKFVPKIYLDDTYENPVNVIQGHDGSILVAFNDYRDQIILEYELRVFNNLKVNYQSDLLDIHNFDIQSWSNNGVNIDYTKQEINTILEKDFIKWAINYGIDYTTNNTYKLDNPFTWNYENYGSWRAVFKFYYDTDRPHSHPWEMLGISEKPVWWDSQYGPLPYTSGNFLLWTDISNGKIANPNGKAIINTKYIKSWLLNKLPVDEYGKLKNPITINLVNSNLLSTDQSWAVGDQGPAETAWRRSSNWPFAVQKLLALTRPTIYSSLMYDPVNMEQNYLGQWLYKPTQSFLNLPSMPIHGENGVPLDSGYGVYISEYGQQYNNSYITELRNDLKYLNFNLHYKVGGFISKNTMQIFIDAYSPTSASPGALLANDDYDLSISSNNPINSVGISGIIIQRTKENFVIRGYDRDYPYFTYYPSIRNSLSSSITIGGVSSEYVNWSPNQSTAIPKIISFDTTTAQSASSSIFYQVGQIVQYGGSFYRTRVSHQAEAVFNNSLFSKLTSLPVVGGISVQLADSFESTPMMLPYGTTFTKIQDLYDLIVGYGKWLTDQGFSFNQFNNELGQVVDWNLSASEFLYWATQNWVNDSIITLSPFADQLTYQFTDSSVDNIFNKFYDYSLTKADGLSFDRKNLFITRQNGVFNVKTINTDDGIYFARLNSLQKEHVIVFKNKTIFGDVIYNTQSGERQNRIKLVGFKTANWNGDFFSPGFLYDSAKISNWTASTSYLASSVVRYNNFYYSAIKNIDKSPIFDFTQWKKLEDKPIAGLLPNFDYKINQFKDFYSLDIDNFDSIQQRLAQNLIGYQPRFYLNNVIDNPISQYKFYQGFIKEKGTANTIEKLANASVKTQSSEIKIYENWALRVGHYGGFNSSKEFEFPLIEGTFVDNPQVISFTSNQDILDYSPIYYMDPLKFTLSPQQGEIPILKTTTSTNVFKLMNAGYVRFDDVTATAYNQNSILDIANNQNLLEGNTIWLGFKPDGGWDILRYTLLNADIIEVVFDTIYNNVTIVTSEPHGLVKGQIVSIAGISNTLDGFYVIDYIQSVNKFTIINNNAFASTDTSTFPGFLFALVSMRFLEFDLLPSDQELYQYDVGTYIWVDSGNDTANKGWAVYKKTLNYYASNILTGKYSTLSQGFGYSISSRNGDSTILVGAPLFTDSINNTSGAIFFYKENNLKIDEISFYSPLIEELGDNNKFGAVVFYDDLLFPSGSNQFGLAFVGAPGAHENKGEVWIASIDRTYAISIVGMIENPSPSGKFGSSIFVQRNTTTKTVLVGSPIVNEVYSYIVTTTSSVIISNPTLINSSVALEGDAQWGYLIVGSDDASCIAISAPYNSEKNEDFIIVNSGTGLTNDIGTVTVIHNNSTQTIYSPFGDNGHFGIAMAMSYDGSYLAISAPNTLNKNNSYGAVAIYNNQPNGIFTLTDILYNIIPNGKMHFGMSLDINSTSDTLVITALGTNTTVLTTFNATTFDFASTRFTESEDYSGTAYLFNRKNSRFVFTQEVKEFTESISSLTNFGTSVVIKDSSIIIGAPSTTNQNTGSIYRFSKINPDISGWEQIRVQDDLVSPMSVKQVRLIDTVSNSIISYYDFVDPIKGKILGVAEEELTYKTSSDPAIYSLGPDGVNVDPDTSWVDLQVGQLWWDLSNAKFIWYEQGELEYRRNNWGKLFPGAGIDIYEWVGSPLLPSDWSAQADTPSGLVQGISGQPKYVDNSVLSVKQVYDNITASFSNVYYYWVKNKITIPNVKNRTISAFSVASYIANPTTFGVQHSAFISSSSIMLSNFSANLRSNEVSLNFTIDNTNNKTLKHVEWQLVREGMYNTPIPKLLEKKLVDSLIGNDSLGNLVPDPTLSDRAKFGIGIRPQQTLFKDRLTALRNIVDFSNSVLKNIQITGNYSFQNLVSQELMPTSTTSSWVVVEDVSMLDDIDTTQVNMVSVESDSNYNNLWSVYEFDGIKWDRVRAQSYNTNLYWKYIDWVSPAYNIYTDVKYVVEDPYQLTELVIDSNTYIKINNRGDGNYVIVTPAKPGTIGTFGANYDLLYIQNGTIQILDSLWNSVGWDSSYAYNQTLFDQAPNKEISYILAALKNDLFINDLSNNWNSLFFKSIRYAMLEQPFIDWAFKTSLIDVVKNSGTLTQTSVYKLQDSAYYENYINEVKPYHSQIRRFTAVFDNIDNADTLVNDFDYPYVYNQETKKFVPPVIPPNNFTYPNSYNTSTGVINIESTTEKLYKVPFREISNKILFDRIGIQDQITNLDIIDNFVGNQGDTVFQLSWVAQADKSKITVIIDDYVVNPTTYTIFYNVKKYLGYNKKYSYLKLLENSIPLDINDNPTFKLIVNYQKSTELMSAAERTKYFYQPVAGMPPNDLSQLMVGARDPRKVIGGQYEGLGFANEDSGMLLDTLINPSDAAYPSWTGRLLTNALGINPSDIIIDGSSNFISTSSNQAPEELVPGTQYDSLSINVYTKLSYQTPTIFNASRNLFKSSSTQAITLSVMPPTVKSLVLTLNNKPLTYVKDITTVAFTSSTTYFSIDWEKNKLIIPRQTSTGILSYSIIGVGDADRNSLGILDSQKLSVITTESTGSTRVISMASYYQVNDVYVTVDGVPIKNLVYPNIPGQPIFYQLSTASNRDIRAALDIFNLSTGTHLIQSWFFNSKNSQYNKILEQNIVVSTTPIFTNDANGFATGQKLNNSPFNAGPPSSQIIVEITPNSGNTTRLRPPFVKYYTITTDDVTSAVYPIVGSKPTFSVDTVQSKNMNVYLNGVSLNYGETLDYVIVDNNVKLTTRQNAFGNNALIGGKVAIETFDYNNITNSVSIINGSVEYDYDFVLGFDGFGYQLLLTSKYSNLTNATIKITTFSVHDSLGIVSDRFIGNPKRIYKLSLPILNANYLWIDVVSTSTGLKTLINDVDYQLLDDQSTVLISDKFVLTSQDTVFAMSFADPSKSSKTLGYRITKDFLGKSSFTRLSKDDSTYLTQPLKVTDTEIYIADGSILSPSNSDKNKPGVVLIAGERIEFFKNINNVLSQLRRGTGGTSPADYVAEGSRVIDQGINQIINSGVANPYSDILLVQNTYTSSNLENTYTISRTTIGSWVDPVTSSILRCDGIELMTDKSDLPNDLYTGQITYKGRFYSISTASIAAKDQIEVYYGGALLRKDQSFYHDTSIMYDGISMSQIKGTVSTAEDLSTATVYLGDAYICEDTGQVWVCAPNQYNLSTVPSYIYSGLVRLLPDFIVDTSTQQIILNTSTVSINTGTKLTVIKREVGPSWNEVISINSTKSLFDSTGTIAKFLKAGPAIIPNQYFYASSSTVANVSSGYSGGGPVINQPVIGEADSGSSTAVFGPNDPEYDGGTSSSIYNDDLDGGSASL